MVLVLKAGRQQRKDGQDAKQGAHAAGADDGLSKLPALPHKDLLRNRADLRSERGPDTLSGVMIVALSYAIFEVDGK